MSPLPPPDRWLMAHFFVPWDRPWTLMKLRLAILERYGDKP